MPTYQWLKDGKILENQITNQLVNVKEDGKYTVQAKFNNCEATSKEIIFSVK